MGTNSAVCLITMFFFFSSSFFLVDVVVVHSLVLAFLLLTAFLGTILDLFFYDSSDIPLSKLSSAKRCFLSFSVPRNFVSIFNPDSSESHLACLHGFRVLTMGWVVMGHTYALTNHQAFGEGKKEREKEKIRMFAPSSLFSFLS